MNRHRNYNNRGVSSHAPLPIQGDSFTGSDLLVQDVQKKTGRRSSASFPTRPIQHPMIGDRIKIEQLQSMSQLTANSLGSAEISYAGPPGHQNSSQSQSSFSASCKRACAPMSLKPVPSVAQTLNPAKALLHLRKCRRVPSFLPQSHSSITSMDKRQSAPLLQFPQDARSTWGTQGSLRSNTSSISLDRDELMRELREELKSLFATKHDELAGSLQVRQEELSAIMEARLRETDRVKAEEMRTLRMTIDNVSEEVKFQVDGLERKLDKMSSDLDTHKDAYFISTRHQEDQAQRLKTEFQNLTATAQDDLKQHLLQAKQELASEGRDLLQVEGQRQLDVIKAYAKSWMTDMTKLAESAASSVIQKCHVPIQMVESLFHTSHKRSSSDEEGKSCTQKSRTITPTPNRNNRNKRLSHRNEPQHYKRPKNSILSQTSTIEKSARLEVQSVKGTQRRVRTIREIAPLELRLSQRSNATHTPRRRTRSTKAPPNINDLFSETISTVSEIHCDHSPVPATTPWHGANSNKENKTPASLKIKSCSLVTPMGTTEKKSHKDGLSPRSSSGHCGIPEKAPCRNSKATKCEDWNQKSNTNDKARKPLSQEPASESKCLNYSQESVALSFPINEVLTENLAECSSPLSVSSALHQTRTRTTVEPNQKKTTKRKRPGVSPKHFDNGTVRLRRRAQKTYSKRPECSFPADDHLTFSFHSEQ